MISLSISIILLSALVLALAAMTAAVLPKGSSFRNRVRLCLLVLALESVSLLCSLLRRWRGCRFQSLWKLKADLRKKVNSRMGGRKENRRENLYRSVFGRVEDYFRRENPYLDMELCIANVAEHVYTNRVYVSRAISECSGSNFCQYVNSYRIRYAMDCFMRNPSLKVTDLSAMSGFRTVASYNMAFRRFVGEVPSEWMRRTGSLIRRNAAKLGQAAPVMQAG